MKPALIIGPASHPQQAFSGQRDRIQLRAALHSAPKIPGDRFACAAVTTGGHPAHPC